MSAAQWFVALAGLVLGLGIFLALWAIAHWARLAYRLAERDDKERREAKRWALQERGRSK